MVAEKERRPKGNIVKVPILDDEDIYVTFSEMRGPVLLRKTELYELNGQRAKIFSYDAEDITVRIQKRNMFMSPTSGEYLLYLFLPRDLRSAVPGDLEEEAQKITEKFGVAGAKFWYWAQVMGYLLWRAKDVLTLGVIGSIINIFRRTL